MSKYRRNYNGSVYFFTLVIRQRRPILTTPLARDILRRSIVDVQQELPFDVTAIVLLPDHLHAIWTMPEGDTVYSARWQRIKSRFSKEWRKSGGSMVATTLSQKKRGEQGVWQRRFFEHTCRDERDFKRCLDYLHVNPLKHGLVNRVCDWPWSTFHRYLALGEYTEDWGSASEWYGDEFVHFE